MKRPPAVETDLERRLTKRWHLDLADNDAWPARFALGRPTREDLNENFPAVQKQVFEWHDYTREHGLVLDTTTVRVHSTTQTIPTHLLISDIDTAAKVLGGAWPDRLMTGRRRAMILDETFPDADTPAVVRATTSMTDTDFGLLLTASRWFADNPADDFTPRQVPIEGLHGKWLNTNLPLVRTLALKPDLGLLGRPARVGFTYLDRLHLAAGGRQHDTATVGDPMVPAYFPRIVIISENKDTALWFPSVMRGVAVEGNGYSGAPGIASVNWIANAEHVVYWGDLDVHGLRILDRFRKHIPHLRSILTDLDTYQRFEKFGTNTDPSGRPLRCETRTTLPHLTQAEQDLYLHLTNPDHQRVRRVEQERIPLPIARDRLLETCVPADNDRAVRG